MQLGFFFDQSRCTGCYACVVACRDLNDIQDMSVAWRRVESREQGRFPNVELSYVSLSCCHCSQPACMKACPVDAITKKDLDGVMAIDRDACLGGDACGACREACPYDVPQFGSEEDPRAQMCTFCRDRTEEQKKPACVEACPMRALDCGPLEDLRNNYGDVNEVRGFRYSSETDPSVVFKSRY